MNNVLANNITLTHPQIASEWSEKNLPSRPECYSAGSNKMAWWKCAKGHEWQTRIKTRTDGCGCPYCAGMLVIQGENDLATLSPGLAAQWSEKNDKLQPNQVKATSGKVVWWICSLGHEWQARISQRYSDGSGCPYCENKKVLPGFNDLATIHPELAREWSEKNGETKPDQFSSGSAVKVWWKCDKGHEWIAAIGARSQGNGCPYCAGMKVLYGFNDLKTLAPELAAQWSDKNQGLYPTEIRAFSTRQVWWKCERGHEWKTSPYHRYRKHSGCPYCGNRRVLAGYNDFATVHPELVKEWSSKNGNLQPSDVIAGSARVVWWKCIKGHEWQAPIYTRAQGNRCPVCGKRTEEKKNNFAALFPDLAVEWSSRNIIQSTDVSFKYGKAVWWKCSTCGYEWYSAIRTRIAGSECPNCKKRRKIQKQMEDARKRYALSKIHENLTQEIMKYFIDKSNVLVEENNLTLTSFPLQYYFPDQKGVIEFSNAANWNDMGRKREIYKNQYCRENGLKMIRILDKGDHGYRNCVCIVRNDDSIESFAEALQTAFEMMGVEVKFDIDMFLQELFEKYLEEW